ncbi:MAG: hypothetical protein AAFY17_03740 [Cyanobacteria bacterium J06642_11]
MSNKSEQLKKDQAVAESSRGKGFGAGTKVQQPPTEASSPSTPGGGEQVLALAGGLGNVVAGQGQALTALTEQTNRGLDVMADHFADYFKQVASGQVLMAKIAERMEAPESLEAEVVIPTPVLPQVSKSVITEDFFQAPKPIALTGKCAS